MNSRATGFRLTVGAATWNDDSLDSSNYHPDKLGSTRALSSAAGTVAATYDHDAYGNLTGQSGFLQSFQFAGQYTDAESGLQYLRARYYDPATEETAALTDLPAYRPAAPATGTIVTWGDPAFSQMMVGWANGFGSFHPEVSFQTFLRGTSTAVGALYTGVAQIGLFGREIRRLERTSWKRLFPYQPTQFTVATGSYNEFAKTVAVAVLVSADNPLTGITLRQLDAIYSRDRRRGAMEPIRRWSQLGLRGEWSDRPIRIFGLDEDTGTANHLQSRLLLDGRWAVDVELPPGAPTEMYAGSGGHAAEALVQALWADRYAIGFGGFRNLAPGLKALAIADDDGRFVEGTRETVTSREYPLSRSVYAVVNKAPDAAWDPKIREFVSFILSREGQQVVAADGGYLPLVARIVNAERAKLD